MLEENKEKNTEKIDTYWKQLSEGILKQEKQKQKQQSLDFQKFEAINRKVIAIHYLLTFLNYIVPTNIQKPFRKICLEIGRSKPLTLKKDEQSQEWQVSKNIETITGKKAEQLEKDILTIIERIKNNSLLIKRIKNEPILLNIALQLEYDSWIEPVGELFEALGIVPSAKELAQMVLEFRKQKQQVMDFQQQEPAPHQKRKRKKNKKRKKSKK